MQRFIVLTTQRTGSTWLIDMLNSHPRIAACSELLRDEPSQQRPRWGYTEGILLWHAYSQKADQWPRGLKSIRLFRYLDEVAFAQRPGQQAAGFKLMYDQSRAHREIWAYLLVRRVRIIHLVRNNLLDMVLSELAVQQRRHAHTAEATPQAVRLEVDCNLLMGQLRHKQQQVQTMTRRCARLRLPRMQLVYEQLVEDHSRFKDVLAFLDMQPDDHVFQSSLQKLNREPHSEMIVNYDQVARTLAGTQFAWMLGAPAVA